jgi:hypothetical protein
MFSAALPHRTQPARSAGPHSTDSRPTGLRATIERSPLAALVRRYRRPLAAVCAGLAVLLTLSALKAPAPAALGTALESGPQPGLGEVAAPVTLASPEIASSLEVGDIIDLVAIPTGGAGMAAVVSRRARVLEIGASNGFGASASALVVVAVPEAEALAIAGATSDSDLTVLIH